MPPRSLGAAGNFATVRPEAPTQHPRPRADHQPHPRANWYFRPPTHRYLVYASIYMKPSALLYRLASSTLLRAEVHGGTAKEHRTTVNRLLSY